MIVHAGIAMIREDAQSRASLTSCPCKWKCKWRTSHFLEWDNKLLLKPSSFISVELWRNFTVRIGLDFIDYQINAFIKTSPDFWAMNEPNFSKFKYIEFWYTKGDREQLMSSSWVISSIEHNIDPVQSWNRTPYVCRIMKKTQRLLQALAVAIFYWYEITSQ